MGLCEGDLRIENVAAPPKTNLEHAIYQRVVNFVNPDVSVLIDSYEFLCHRMVLQCYSEFFSQAKNAEEIEVNGVTKGAFIAIYNWMLAEEKDALRHIQKNNVLEMLIASKILAIPELENQCLALIHSEDAFSEESAFFLFIDASRRLQTDIMDLMVPRIRYFFLLLVSSVEFDSLDLNDLCAILQSNSIVVHCELEIFMSAIKWLMAKWKSRSKLIGSVMRCVRFGLMTPAQLVDIRKNPMSSEFLRVTSNKTVQLLIEDGLSYSVEKNLSGKQDQHAERCELLRLKVPEPRNWAANSREYGSYNQFLTYLDDISSDSKKFYADIRGKPSKKADLKIGHYKVVSSDSEVYQIGKPYDFLSQGDTPEIASEGSQNFGNLQSKIGGAKCISEPGKSASSSMMSLKRSSERFHRMPSRRVRLKDQAAIVLQSAWRGYAVRRKLNSKPKRVPAESRFFDNMYLGFGSREGVNVSKFTMKNRSQHFCSSSESMESIVSVKEIQRKASKRIVLTGGIDPTGNKRQSLLTARQVYALDDMSWQQIGSIPSPRYYHGSAWLNGRIYLVGGCHEEFSDSKSVPLSGENYSFDLKCGEWKAEPCLITPRRSFGLVACNGRLFAIGGQDETNTILSSVERYDPDRKVWDEMSPLPEPLIGSAVCVHDGEIWVVGGMNGNTANVNVSRSVWCYDPKNDLWFKKSSLRFGRAFASLVTYENQLFLVGGVANENGGIVSNDHVDVWNEECASWRLKGHIDVPRHGHTVAFIGSFMVLLGGVTTKNIEKLSQVEAFCVKTGSRSKQIAPLPHPLIGH
ncbi:unnamed protein product, partial [Nesidiocoris tenuis]